MAKHKAGNGHLMRVADGERKMLMDIRRAMSAIAQHGNTFLGGVLVLAHGRRTPEGSVEGNVSTYRMGTDSEGLDRVGSHVLAAKLPDIAQGIAAEFAPPQREKH